MTNRMYYFVWEQVRQLSWLVFAIANALFAFIVAEVTAYLSNYITRGDAANLSDIYAMVSILFVIIGTHFSIERGRELELIVPVRVMRLPIGSYALATGWVFTRALCVAGTLLGILLFRQLFTEGKTELPVAPSFVYYLTVYLVLLALARVAAVWRDQAIPWAVLVGVVVFAFASRPLWYVAKEAPVLLLLAALPCLPVAVLAIVLRRRGGVYLGGLDLVPMSMQQQYQRMAEIPAFEDRLAAQAWFEWRWHGKVLPGLVLFGCCAVLGATLLLGVDWYDNTNPNFVDLAWSLIGILFLAAVLTALYLLASDALRIRRAQSRFLYVQPMGGRLFAQARQRLLLRSAGWGVFIATLTGIALVATIGLSAGGAARVSENSNLQDSRGVDFTQDIISVAYAPDPLLDWEYRGYDAWKNFEALGTGATRLAGLISVALVFGALLFVGNRFSVLALGIMFVSFIVFEPAEFGVARKVPQATLCAALSIFISMAMALGSALYARVIRPWQAFRCVAVYLGGGLALYMLGPGNWLEQPLFIFLVALFPLAFPLVVIVIARPAMAVAYQARRAGVLLPPRLAGPGGRDPQWAQVGLTVAVASLVVLCAGLAWRTVSQQAFAGELVVSRTLGIAPESPRPAGQRPGALEPGHAGLLSAHLLRLKLDYYPVTRRLAINAPKIEVEAELAPVFEDAQRSPGDDLLQALNGLLPELHGVIEAIEQLPNAPAPEMAAAAQRLDDSFEHYSEEEQVVQIAGTINGVVTIALEQCFLYAMAAAERRDATACAEALHAQVQLLAMHGGCRHFQNLVQRSELLEILLETLEYVLPRTALPPGQSAELLALLPPEISEEDVRYALHAGAVLPGSVVSGGSYYEPFGRDTWVITSGAYLQGHVEDALQMNTIAEALLLSYSSEALLKFQQSRTHLGATYSARSSRIKNSPLEFWTLDKLRTFPRQVDMGDSLLNLARTVLALEVYRERQGAYPESLEALVPEILPAVPIDWTSIGANGTEKTVHYQRTSLHSIRAYTFGEDRVDNQGGRRVYMPRPGEWTRVGDVVVRISRP